jgi:hypothetical protein
MAKITKVSKYGFQVDNIDKWHNYDKYKIKPEQMAEQSDIGKEIAYELNDKGFVVKLGAVKGEVPAGEEGFKIPEKIANMHEETGSKGTKHDAKTLDIHRQVAVKTAFEYAGNQGLDIDVAFNISKQIEDYLNE